MVSKTFSFHYEIRIHKQQYSTLEKLRQKSRHVLSRTYLPRGVKAVAVDSNEYLKINPDNIPADERFLYTLVMRLA